jgi:hypothetical protein
MTARDCAHIGAFAALLALAATAHAESGSAITGGGNTLSTEPPAAGAIVMPEDKGLSMHPDKSADENSREHGSPFTEGVSNLDRRRMDDQGALSSSPRTGSDAHPGQRDPSRSE